MVYSFGIADNWLFDDLMVARGCDVRSFDPSMAAPRHWRAPRHLFEPLGIGAVSGIHTGKSTLYGGGEGYEVRSLRDLMRANNHSRVDIVRMDVESAEWDVLEAWHAEGLWPRVGQLLLEAHLWHDIRESAPRAADVVRFASLLRRIPLRLFSAARNPWDETQLPYGMTRIYELGFVND